MEGRVALLALEQHRGTPPCIGEIRHFDASGFGDVRAAPISKEGQAKEDDPILRILGAHGQLLERVLGPVRRRVADLPRERIGLYIALGSVDTDAEDLAPAVLASRDPDGVFDLETFFRGGYRQVHPLWPLTTLNNVALGQLAIDLDVRGDNLVLTSEADAGIRALLEARAALLGGVVDAALVGGVSDRITPASLARRRLRGQPLGEDGALAPAEGAAAVLLVRVEDAAPGVGTMVGGATAFGQAGDRAGPSKAAMRRALRVAEGFGPAVVVLVTGGAEGEVQDLEAVAAECFPGVAVALPAREDGHAGSADAVAGAGLALARGGVVLATSSEGAVGCALFAEEETGS